MSRWVVHSRVEFEASHALTLYLGEPEEHHSHRWQVAIRVGADELNAEGYALDFHAVHALLPEITAPLADTDLNVHPEIGSPTPTAERLAKWIADQLAPECAELGGSLLSVSVWEGPENRVDLVLEHSLLR